MCGFYGKLNSQVEADKYNLIRHRGPDKTYLYSDKKLEVSFHRLAINGNDDDGSQPFYSDNKDILVWCNGEVFNYKDLAKEYNIQLKNGCDLHILPELFTKENPEKVLSKIRGFFSMVVYNKAKNTLSLAIDHFGIKPLYYQKKNDQITFSSEMRVFSKNIDVHGLKQYFETGSSIPCSTLNKDIKALNPGQLIQFKLNNLNSTSVNFWKIDKEKIGKLNISEEEVESNLIKALQRNSISDYPIYNLLSGGVDSTFLALYGKQISKNLFFDFGSIKSNHEIDNIRKLKELVPIQTIELDFNLIDELDSTIQAMDEPVYDFATLIYNVLMKAVSKTGQRVIWNGTGGDELFFGYNRYHPIPRIKSFFGNIVGKDPLNNPYDFLKKGFLNRFDRDKIPLELSRNQFENTSEYFRYIDFNYYLPNTLFRYTDRISSFHSIEARVPFMDVDLVEAVFYSRLLPQEVGNKIFLKSLIHKKAKNLDFNFKEGLGLPIEKLIDRNTLKIKIIPKIIESRLLLEFPQLNRILLKDMRKRKNLWNLMGLYVVVKWYEM